MSAEDSDPAGGAELEELWPDLDRRAAALERLARDVSGPERDCNLRPSELRVLEALSHGLGRSGAVEVTGYTLETVKDLLKRSKRVLGAKDTTHAVAEALRRGLIS